ncbi:MAG: hypothetical protein BGO30_11190 [Bacteroidetes bacterium 41-46]|jgi:rod shape-determining protein MreC|nr:MAG: hypothetical protein BGO30_11190 [Bacteroidetes bacterium 41-46]
MTKKRSPRFQWLVSLLVFIVLQTISIIMISESSFFQQLKISGAYMSIRGALSKSGAEIKYYFSLRDVNRELAAENEALLAELEKLRETDCSRDTSEAKYTYISAQIVANSTNNKQNFIIIDKGRRDGVEEDMGVVSPNGIVGVVSKVSDRYSYIISLLNINQSVSARIGREGAFGPLFWSGRDASRAVLTDIPQHIRVTVGDTIFTSGYSTIFPPDIPIGTAGRYKIIRGTHKEIQVRFFQDFKTLKFVRVVKSRDKQELDNLINSNEARGR